MYRVWGLRCPEIWGTLLGGTYRRLGGTYRRQAIGAVRKLLFRVWTLACRLRVKAPMP